jgi:hypothetical protein
MSMPEQCAVFFVDPDELHQGPDAEVGERQDAVFSDAIDPDAAVLGVHFIGAAPKPVRVFAEILGDAIIVVTR